MKKLIIAGVIGVSIMTVLSGCVLSFNLGGGKKDSSSTSSTTSNNNTTSSNTHPVVQQTVPPTVGQQLIDLKKAKDSGAITEAEYEAEKAKILNQK
jgi:hypothetical protein